MTLFAKNAKNPTCAIFAQVEGTTLTGWAEHYARKARKDGPCPICNDTGTDGETLPTGYYVEFPCGECLTRHRAAVSAEVRALIDLERGAQAEQWGGHYHDKAHTPAEWASYITYQTGMATQYPDAFKNRMIKIAALAIAAYEAMS